MRKVIQYTFATLALGALSAQGALVNLDYGSAQGSFAGDGPLGGGTWNVTTATDGAGGAITGLVDSTGAASTVQVTFDDGSTGAWGAHGRAPIPDNYAIYQDYRHSTTGFTIGGLAPGESYDLALFSSLDLTNLVAGWSVEAGQFTVGGTNVELSDMDPTDLDVFSENVNYAMYSAVVADGSGNITVAMDAASHSEWGVAGFNGLQLNQVPEPSTAALLGLCLVGFTVRRRR